MNDYILTRLEFYLNESLLVPTNYLFLPDTSFKKLSYARETVYIIMDRISDNPFKDGWDIIWSFALNLEYRYRIAETPEAKFIINVMRKTIEDILRL